jgi:SAM-dependent methyltransferase
MPESIFPANLRTAYDERVLDVNQRTLKALNLQRALKAAGLWNSPSKILDVGSGSALILAALGDPGTFRIGCDVRSELYLRGGAARAITAFVQSDALNLPFRGRFFDLVLCLAVIEELADWSAAVAALAECVAPGGILYMTVTNGKSLEPFYAFAGKLRRPIDQGSLAYAKSSLRIAERDASLGFGLEGLRDWHFVDATPYLARAQFPILRYMPISLLSRFLRLVAPSFAYAWRRQLPDAPA